MGSRFRLEREEEEGWHRRRPLRHLDKWCQIIFPLSGERLWGWYWELGQLSIVFLKLSPFHKHEEFWHCFASSEDDRTETLTGWG